ncbi:MAG: RNA polymerase subunit sigma-24, partial [Actinomycetota bacterium]
MSDPNDQLFRTEHGRLWRSLVAYCGDADVAAEAEAEAFTQALARGDELIDPRAWLWRYGRRFA